MGQYWKAVIGNEQGSNIRTLGYPAGCPKLTEHAYFNDDYVEFVCWILSNRGRVYWLGDYATEDDFDALYKENPEFLPDISVYELNQNDCQQFVSIPNKVEFRSEDKFLVNHDTREYIDLAECKKIAIEHSPKYERFPFIFHPLPLLTAVGNGKGLGDFREGNIGYENVGKWTWNVLSVDNDEPLSGFKKVQYYFVERRK